MTALFIAAWCLAGACALLVLLWSVVLYRILRTLRERPTVRSGTALPAPSAGWPRLSVIVPAHNEECDIARCAAALIRQDYPALEIIFVLDRCTDGTAAALAAACAGDGRVIAIENRACPEDWGGKQHAVHLGTERAAGEYLLFTDADTEAHPALCRAAVALALEHDAHLLTLLSTLASESFHERVAQPVASMSLMEMFPLRSLSRQHETRPFANGQFMLFRRDWYERIGGHEAVKDEVSEDMTLARRLDAVAGRALVLLADGMLRSKMYDSFPAFVQGWRRIFTDACKRRPHQLRKYGRRILLAGVAAPLLQVAALILAVVLVAAGALVAPAALAVVVAAGWIVQAISLAMMYRVSGAPRWAIVAYPLGCWIVGRILLRSARDLEHRRPMRWAGRDYVPEPR